MNRETLCKGGIILGVALGIALLGTAWQLFFSQTFPTGNTTYIYVDTDDNTDSVQVKISKAACPNTTVGFNLLTAVTDYQVRTGRYAIEPDDNILAVYRKLKRGQQEAVSLALPSVRTMDRLAAVLGHKLMLDSATLASSFADTAFCSTYGYTPETLPCLFIPNTYQVYWDASLPKFMARMQNEHERFWNDERRQKAEEAGLTPNEVMTLASIVDEETANNDEKPMVAGMYINRLKNDMPLQADPTVKFALKDFALRRIYHNHLLTPSPYNTYRNTGLPPGPIRIPSIAGIDAVLNHVKHDYLYMCAKEDFSGTHNFARTYAEHLANAARYSAALNKRGIK